MWLNIQGNSLLLVYLITWLADFPNSLSQNRGQNHGQLE